MPSDEFEKYLNQLPEKDRAEVDQAIEGLKNNSATNAIEADNDLKTPKTPNDKPKGYSTEIGENTTTTGSSLETASPEVKAEAAKEGQQLANAGVEPPAQDQGTPTAPEQPAPEQGTLTVPEQSPQLSNNAQETDSNTQIGNSSIIDQTRQKANSTPETDNNLNKEAETIQQAGTTPPVPEQSPQSSSNAQTTVSDTPQAGNSSLVDQTKENANKAQEQPVTEKEKSLSEKTQAQNRDDDLER